MVTPEHFEKAITGGAQAAQNAAQYAHERGCNDREAHKETPVIPEEYGGVRHCMNVQVAGTGLELDSVSRCEDKGLEKSTRAGGAKSGALGAHSDLIDPDLQAVIDAWPTLPEKIRAEVMAVVRKAGQR